MTAIAGCNFFAQPGHYRMSRLDCHVPGRPMPGGQATGKFAPLPTPTNSRVNPAFPTTHPLTPSAFLCRYELRTFRTSPDAQSSTGSINGRKTGRTLHALEGSLDSVRNCRRSSAKRAETAPKLIGIPVVQKSFNFHVNLLPDRNRSRKQSSALWGERQQTDATIRRIRCDREQTAAL